MKPKNSLILVVAIILLSIISVACSKSQETTPAQNPVTTQEPGAATQQPGAATQQPGSVTSEPTGAPEDVPIMPDAYELQVPNQLNIIYKINAQIKDVVTFYQQELPANGWDQINNPDSVVGSMAQMARSKTNGDRLTFALSYNPVGEFTIVQIYINRAP
jgi:hypothetical protein